MTFLLTRDLLAMLRQRETLVWTFVMPIVFFYFLGTVTGGFGASSSEPDRLWLRGGSGLLQKELELRLAGLGYEVSTGETAPQAGADLTLRVPDDFTAHVLAGLQRTVTLEIAEEGNRADYHRVRVARAVYGLVADLAAIARDDAAPTREEFQALADAPRSVELDVAPAGKRKRIPTGYEQTIPGTMVMFTLMIMLTTGAVSLFIERESGLLRRLASAPLSRGEIVWIKWGSRYGLGAIQIAFAMVVGAVVFRLDWGPDLPMVVVVVLAWGALCASLGVLLGSLARSSGQVIAIAVLAANVLAALGGCWWPIEITPRWMQALAGFLPTGWTMDAMHRLISFQNGAADAARHVALLLVAALIAGWLAARKFRFA